MLHPLLPTAITNVTDILAHTVTHDSSHRALVIFDKECGLTQILTEAYRAALPHALFLDFDTTPKESIISAFDDLRQDDLVVLVQSMNFRLDQFRIRLHLFEKGLKVIEHTHLLRNSEDTWQVYINALAYDPAYYRTLGPALKAKLENTTVLRITSKNGAELGVTSGLESPKLNIGDYSGMKNIGGTFPIGEVFTEAKNFSDMNGAVYLYGMAGSDFCINMHEPFRVDIKEGLVVGWSENAPKTFVDMIELIRPIERTMIREIGFGLNRAITREHYIQDITAFERILGLHLSIGEKHSVYKKPGITPDKARFHVDVFPVVDTVTADGEVIFQSGKYLV